MNTLPGTIKDGKVVFNERSLAQFVEGKEGKTFDLVERVQNRTDRQNRALHLYLTQVAETLDKEGHTVQDVVAQIKKAEIHPTGAILKEVVWRPIQQIVVQKESTTELKKLDVDKVYEVVNKWLGQHFGIHVPWPHFETEEDYINATLTDTPNS